MQTLLKLIKKYRELILYAFFGVFTTAINILVYHLAGNVLKIPNVPSTILAWFFSVIFAFVTNKIWVFNSKSWAAKIWLPEFFKFLTSRLATGALDVGIMWLAVDILNMPNLIWKIIANVVVIVINYIISKLVVFKKKQA